jgi:hypothetical protein
MQARREGESGSGSGSRSSISSESGSGYGHGSNPDPGFDDQKLKKKIERKNFFDQKLQFTYYVQDTGEAFSPQRRTYSTSNNEIYQLFSMLVGHFCPSGSGSREPIESGSGSTAKQIASFCWKDTVCFEQQCVSFFGTPSCALFWHYHSRELCPYIFILLALDIIMLFQYRVILNEC